MHSSTAALPTPRTVRAYAHRVLPWLGWIVLTVTAPLFAQGNATPPAPSAPAKAPAAPAAPIALSDVVVAAARADALRHEIIAALEADDGWKLPAGQLDDVEARMREAIRMLRSGEFGRLRYDTLVDVDSRIREREREIATATREIATRLSRLERDVARLDREIAAWPERVRVAAERKAPEAILERAKRVEPELEATRDAVTKRRNELLLDFDRSTRVLSQLDTLRLAVAARRDAIGQQLRGAHEAPIWADSPPLHEHGIVSAEFAMARQLLGDYVRTEGPLLLLGLAAIATLVGVPLRRRAVVPSVAGACDRASRSDAIAAGILVALVTLAFLAPSGPTAFYPLWWLPVPLLAAWVACRLLGISARPTLWALAAAGSINTLHSIAELYGHAGRILLVLQILPIAVALAYDWRRRALDRQLARWHPITVRMLVIAMLTALGVTIVADAAGFVGLARMLRGATITATSAAIVFAVTAAVVNRAIASLLQSSIAQRLRGVREEGEAVQRFFAWIVNLAAAAGLVLLLIYTQNLADPARRWLNAINEAKISVREVDISAGSIGFAVLIVLATVALTRLVRFLLTIEVLPRFGLRAGIPFAIATLTGYAIALVGFVLALAALGVDLTKVTLLAGALGVGIGFGLQNVVNNFVSGLILMLERPVKVGDQVAIGELLGDVRRIGMRSSTVRTMQGAEVIVPNSDLVSTQVVNWTLSDRSRRYEIDVGVAYGTDVDAVMKLLEEAARSVPEVKKVPAPLVLFAGFGESSLDFRVLAWAESVDVGLQAQNNLRRGILASLTQAGIEIPYPQRDVHVRTSLPPGSASMPR